MQAIHQLDGRMYFDLHTKAIIQRYFYHVRSLSVLHFDDILEKRSLRHKKNHTWSPAIFLVTPSLSTPQEEQHPTVAYYYYKASNCPYRLYDCNKCSNRNFHLTSIDLHISLFWCSTGQYSIEDATEIFIFGNVRYAQNRSIRDQSNKQKK